MIADEVQPNAAKIQQRLLLVSLHRVRLITVRLSGLYHFDQWRGEADPSQLFPLFVSRFLTHEFVRESNSRAT